MTTILLHSSKTMRQQKSDNNSYQIPHFLTKSQALAQFIKTLSTSDIKKTMQLSDGMAIKTHELLRNWSTDADLQTPAIDIFIGDIYSGLQVQSLSKEDREYANKHLYILSGLYGILRALDCIMPYRLEMDYRFKTEPYTNLSRYWGDDIANYIPVDQPIVNLSANEYTKGFLHRLQKSASIASPRFLTRDPITDEPKFIVVHAKIARGAYAKWLITERIEDPSKFNDFSELGYSYEPSLSTPQQPVFICDAFQGLGLSVRLS
jgi:uncharacterized protein